MPKLTIGAAGDQYEKEADAVASQVVQQLNSSASVQRVFGDGSEEEAETVQMKPIVQRQGASAGGAASPELERSIQRERGKGQTLSESLRNPLENAFGADFSGVRIHTDNTADQLNQSIQAKAFTTGQDVFFRQGAYAPESKSGQALLAHELTHTIQQGSSPTVQRTIDALTQINIIQRNGDDFNSGMERRSVADASLPHMSPVLKESISPKVFTDIINWLKGKANRQNKAALFQEYFLKQPLDVQEKTILKIIQPALPDLTVKQKKLARSPQEPYYYVCQFTSDVKKSFREFSIKGNAIDWDKFAGVVRASGGQSPLLQSDKGDSSSLETFKNIALEVSGTSALDSDLQTGDRAAGGATLASNVALATSQITTLISKEAGKAVMAPLGIVSGIGDAATGAVNAYEAHQRAQQSRDLQNSQDQNIALGAQVNKRNQQALRTDNIGLAVQGVAAVALTAVGLATMTFPIVTVVGLGILAGRKIYQYFKTKLNKKKFVDQLLGLEEMKDGKPKDQKREEMMQKNGYTNIDSMYSDFVKMLSSDLYLRGVLGGDPEAVQLINALGLKIDRTKQPPTPMEKVIASKYGV
ncbi:DUF4157 domain-containing protein [Spirulina sp. CCNP1310]|uniref:eCIS core domain-containing protein n=1 Tax=Spirulina sp. CCNP1310 TaxID=3110249 RepID=UPI002B1F8201|nr:DUF4157 domain-containing protein [Spirulina sp. CCNP1310]MEA5420467.1 DUF4157 domain-containing protein [Spirulina sp. CCNP1310]